MSIKSVPFIDLARYEPGFVESFLEDVRGLVQKTQFVGGPSIGACEETLRAASGSKFVVGCANGTDAIQVALRAMGVGEGDTVLVPDMTFWATFEAVVNVGARPILLDVSRETLHWTAAAFEKAVTERRPKAAILVHLYGWACPDTEAIRQAATRAGCGLLEDCAQAYGVKLNGRPLIGGASVATTSFYPAKTLGASGDAGAIFLNDAATTDRVRSLVNHGRLDHYSHGLVGWNSRLGAYEASFLLRAHAHFDTRIASRRHAVDRYARELTGLPLRIQRPAASVWETGYCSVGLIDPARRPALIEHLKAKGVGFGTIYPGAMGIQPAAAAFLVDRIGGQEAEYVSKAVLNLPVFAGIRDDEIDYVIKTVRDFFAKG